MNGCRPRSQPSAPRELLATTRVALASLFVAGLVAIIVMAFTCGLTLASQGEAGSSRDDGSICVASVPLPTPGELSLGNPTGGGRTFEYSIQIDGGKIVDIPHDKGLSITKLALNGKHLVKIRKDGKVVESFRFSFGELHSTDLCLFFKSLYETWNLWTGKEARTNCDCAARK